MSSEGGAQREAPKPTEVKKKGEEFKEKEVMGKTSKEHTYVAHARKMSTHEIFRMFSGFKKKWAKSLLGVLRKLLG